MKKQLNTYHQHRRIDPDEIEFISANESEDPLPDIMDFLGLPHTGGSALALSSSSSVPIPNCPTTTATVLPAPSLGPWNLATQGSADLDWADVLADPLHAASPMPAPPNPGYAMSKPTINWVALRPTFLDANAKNDHELVPTGKSIVIKVM